MIVLGIIFYILIGIRLTVSLLFRAGLPEENEFEVIVLVVVMWPMVTVWIAQAMIENYRGG